MRPFDLLALWSTVHRGHSTGATLDRRTISSQSFTLLRSLSAESALIYVCFLSFILFNFHLFQNSLALSLQNGKLRCDAAEIHGVHRVPTFAQRGSTPLFVCLVFFSILYIWLFCSIFRNLCNTLPTEKPALDAVRAGFERALKRKIGNDWLYAEVPEWLEMPSE